MNWAQRYGPWAIVTGASSGLGEAFAHAIAARGVRPLLVARRADDLARVAADVEREHGVTCEWHALDLADASFVDALLDATQDKDVGLVVGNAGFNPPGAFTDHDRAALERVLDVNARANLLLADAFVPRLVARRHGGLLFVASVEAYFGVPYSTAYAASKAYVLSLAEGLWGELKRAGVDVLALVPGPLDTPLYRSREAPFPAMAPRTAAELALDRLGRGPSFVPAATDRWTFRTLRALPRPTAVRLMGFGLRRTLERMRRKSGRLS
jgi:short-subunit dehydrogenase